MDAFVFIIGIIIIVIAFTNKVVLRDWINPITVFIGLWGLILFAYSFRFYGIYQASTTSILVTLTGLISFVAGCLLPAYLQTKKGVISKRTSVDELSEKPNYYFLIVFNAIAILVLFASVIETIRMLRAGFGFDYIHSYFYSEESGLRASTGMNLVRGWFLWPWTYAILPIIPVAFFADTEKTKEKKWFIITAFIVIILYVLVSGARVSLVYCLMFFALVYYIQGKRIKMNLGKKILVLTLVVLIIWVIYYISVSRGQDIFRSAYIYFCGCVPYFSVRFEELDSIPRMYSLFSMNGLYRLPILAINKILRSSSLSNLKDFVTQLTESTQTRYAIGPGIGYNAFLGPFYYFYVDGGIIGVIILSLLYGYFCCSLFFAYKNNPTYKNTVIYLLVLFGLAFSMVRFQFTTVRYFLAFIYVIFGFAKLKIRFTIRKKHR